MPVAVDLFCKAGGASRGIAAAGFEVIGVDIEPQPRYPYKFLRADVFDVFMALKGTATGVQQTLFGYGLDEIDLIWASPPCQANTALKHAHNAKKHECLIGQTRYWLEKCGRPWVIENVVGAPLRNPTTYCGTHFGLGFWTEGPPRVRYDLQRHRGFEASFELPPAPCNHDRNSATVGVYGAHVRCRSKRFGGRGTVDFSGFDKDQLASAALGLPRGSMTMDEYSNAIPPIYAQRIAEAALASIAAAKG